jgi:protein SCO1/2
MSSSALKYVRIGAWIAVGIVVGVVASAFLLMPRGQNPATPIVASTIGGPFSLVDQHGATVTEASLKGHPSALFFGFTFCPDVCPTTLADLSVWLQQLGPYGDRLKVFFVTVDPARDTRDVLADYLRAFDPRIRALTGTQADIDQMLKNYRVFARRVPGQGDAYTFDHTASVYLLDANGGLTGTITYDEDPVVAYEKIRRHVGIAVS